MEIKVNIPTNDYVKPTEVRQEVVQAICDVFLSPNCWSIFHPFNGSAYRNEHRYVKAHENGRYYGFASWHDYDFTKSHPSFKEKYLKFNGEEMKTAFQVLKSAGYHMFRVYEYGSWMGYKCSKKPFLEGGREVTEFTDFID